MVRLRLHPERVPASTVVNVYIVLLLAIPSSLVVRPIGAAGSPATLWGFFALLWWICATISGLKPRGWRSPVCVALTVLTVSVMLSYLSGMTRGWYAPADLKQVTDQVYDALPPGLAQIRSAMLNAADRGLIAFGAWMGIALVISDGVRSRDDLGKILRCLTTVAGVLAALGVLQYYTGTNIARFVRLPGLSANQAIGAVQERSVLRRINVTATHPIEFGVVMASIFPLALHRAIFRVNGSRRDLLPAVAIGIAIPLSISRSAVLVFLAGMLVMLIGWPAPRRRQLLKLAPFLIVGIRVAFPGVVGTIFSLFKNAGSDPSITGRTDDYTLTTRVIEENPLFGRGLFTFVPRYYRILDNQFLMILLELGAVGLVAVIGLALSAFFCALGARRRSEDAWLAHFGLALAAAICGLVLSLATFDAWGFAMAAGLMFILVGLASAAWAIARDAQVSTQTPCSSTT
jgi:O-antigen ligase